MARTIRPPSSGAPGSRLNTAMPPIRTRVAPRLMGWTSLHFDAVGPLGGRLGDPQGEDAVLQMGLDAVLVDRTGQQDLVAELAHAAGAAAQDAGPLLFLALAR